MPIFFTLTIQMSLVLVSSLELILNNYFMCMQSAIQLMFRHFPIHNNGAFLIFSITPDKAQVLILANDSQLQK